MIKKTPITLAGVMLGVAALGNLLQSYSEQLRLVCGMISALIGIILLVKFISYPQLLKADLENPLTASVAGTFSMSLILLAVYLKPISEVFALYMWYSSIALHMLLMLYFTKKFMFDLDIKKMFPSYFSELFYSICRHCRSKYYISCIFAI